MSALDLLQRNIVKYIYEQGWPSLRRIQEAAIQQAHDTSNNLILAAPTASGKTEAAFIPAINGITDWSSGVKIIYVSPLIALINDQFKRITELCEYMDVPVTSWHGESSRTRKKQLLKDPRGILLITPESLEAMLTRRPGEAQALFGDVEWVIVDELHSFLDTSRGVHVKSLLGRISRLAKKAPRYIGMTATLNRESYSLAKSFFISSRDSSVLLDGSRNELSTTIVYERSDGVGTPSGIIDNIYDYSCRESMLVFPNARGRVEEIAVGLKRRAKKSGNNVRYFAHHASVDKELRLEAEEFAKASKQQLFTICCTSTLELGIDIGAVDSVAQVEGPPSVASLAQRLGRSGRQKQHSILHLYASKEWSLLQGIATLELYKHGTIEEVAPIKKPYNVLVQQILSLLLQFSGMSRQDLLAQLHSLECWGEISSNEIEQVIDHLKDIDFIEDVDHVYVTGISAERTIESKDFYAHFEPKVEFQVLSNHEHIGEMPLSTAVTVGANVFLAARIWKIMDVDSYGKKIRVIPAEDGKAPIFGGGAGDVSHLVRREMLACLQDVDRLKSDFDPTIQEALAKLANENLAATPADLLIKEAGHKQTAVTFAGTKINRTLSLFLRMRNDADKEEDLVLDDFDTSITSSSLTRRWESLLVEPISTQSVVQWFGAHDKELADTLIGIKYLELLPNELQIDYLVSNYFDVNESNVFLSQNEKAIN